MAPQCAASPSRGDHLAEATSAEAHSNDRLREPSDWLCDWFVGRKKFKGETAVLLSLNYFEAGLLSSLEVIEFISEIESRFGVTFSEQDFQDPRFVTIAGVSELISDLQAKSLE